MHVNSLTPELGRGDQASSAYSVDWCCAQQASLTLQLLSCRYSQVLRSKESQKSWRRSNVLRCGWDCQQMILLSDPAVSAALKWRSPQPQDVVHIIKESKYDRYADIITLFSISKTPARMTVEDFTSKSYGTLDAITRVS